MLYLLLHVPSSSYKKTEIVWIHFMKSLPDLITTSLVVGGNAVLRVFDRSTTVPNNDSRRRELESVSGLYGDDLLQTIDVYAMQSYRVLNEEVDRVWQEIHHEVATIHPTLRNRLQALSGAVGLLNERVHSHTVAAIKLQQSIEESYVEFDNLAELSDKVLAIEFRIKQKEQEQQQARAAIKTGFNNLLDGITEVKKDSTKNKTKDNANVSYPAEAKQTLFEEKLGKLEQLDLIFERLKLSHLKSVQTIRTSDKTLVDIRLDFEEQKALPRPFSKWTLEQLEEQQLQLKPKIIELNNQLRTLKDNYAESDRRGSMYRLEQESLEKELAKLGTTLASTEQELSLHRIDAEIDGKQKQFSTVVQTLRKHSQDIDLKIVKAIHTIAEIVVDTYRKQQLGKEHGYEQDISDILFSNNVRIEDMPKLRHAFSILQKFEGLRLRNQQHFLRTDIWLNERKIKKLRKDLKDHKQLGANKGSFSAASKEIEQEIEKRDVEAHQGLHNIFKTHLELLLDRHKQPKECLETSQFAFEKACQTKDVSFEDFVESISRIVGNSQFEKEQTPQDLVRRKAILSCIRTKNAVINASKVLKSKHAEVLLVASETRNLLHPSDNLMKRRKKVSACKKKLREIETEIIQLLNH